MAKSSKEKILNYGLGFVGSVLLLLIVDIWATVKDTHAFQLKTTSSITKLKADVGNLKADVISLEGFREDITERVGRIDDAVFHVQ